MQRYSRCKGLRYSWCEGVGGKGIVGVRGVWDKGIEAAKEARVARCCNSSSLVAS